MVNIPDMIDGLPVTAIEHFPNSSLTSVTIPDSVTSIGDNAFGGCTSLTSMTIPDSVTSIGTNAFENCTSLTNVTIGSGVTSISDSAFDGCSALTSVTIPNSVTSIGDNAFSYCWNLTSVTIPNSVTNIGDAAFFGCGLTNVTIGSGVTSIGDEAFNECGNLTSITIPNSVSSIGTGTFDNCDRLRAITVNVLNPTYSSVDGVLFNKSQTILVTYPAGIAGAYTIPNSVTSIGDSAFFTCLLSSVTIPNNVTSIGDYAFQGCTSLTSVTIGSGVTSIGDEAFWDCTTLTNVYFRGNAPSVGWNAFSHYPPYSYYLPGTTGWAAFATNTGTSTKLWTLPYPLVLQGSVGVQSNLFGFTVSWATNLSVVVEASTDLAGKTWTPVLTNALNNGVVNFSDPEWRNYPSRFYRVRSQ
jgi:hypothetical protein